MNSLRLSVSRPKEKELLAASIRVTELEDLILKLVDHQSDDDLPCLRAMVVISSKRFIELLDRVHGPIYGYAMSQEDHAIVDWCNNHGAEEKVFSDAQSVIKILDNQNLYGGYPNIDEIATAILNVARHMFRGAWR